MSDLEIPDELREAIERSPDAAAAFEGLPPSHQVEYVMYVEEVHGGETRERRAARAVEMMMEDKVGGK